METPYRLASLPPNGLSSGKTGGANLDSELPGHRRERERLALIEAEIAQTCYHLSLLRAEHRRLRAQIALLETTATGSAPQQIANSR